MKRILFILALLLPNLISAQGPAMGVKQVPDLAPATLQSLPENEAYFFIGTEKQKWNDARIVVNYKGKLENIVNELSWYHKQAPEKTKSQEIQLYTWKSPKNPMWFYTWADFYLEVAPQGSNHFQLSYHCGTGGAKDRHGWKNLIGYPTHLSAMPMLQQRIDYALAGYPSFHPFRPQPENEAAFISLAQQRNWNFDQLDEVILEQPAAEGGQKPTATIRRMQRNETQLEIKTYTTGLTLSQFPNWEQAIQADWPQQTETYRMRNQFLEEYSFKTETQTEVQKIYHPDDSTSINAGYIRNGDAEFLQKIVLHKFRPSATPSLTPYAILHTATEYPWNTNGTHEEISLDQILDAIANWQGPGKPDTLMHKWSDQGTYQYPMRKVGPQWSNIPSAIADDAPIPAIQEHQIWIGATPMEKWIEQNLGYTPTTLVFEVYQYGAMFFGMNPQTRKYQYWETKVLE